MRRFQRCAEDVWFLIEDLCACDGSEAKIFAGAPPPHPQLSNPHFTFQEGSDVPDLRTALYEQMAIENVGTTVALSPPFTQLMHLLAASLTATLVALRAARYARIAADLYLLARAKLVTCRSTARKKTGLLCLGANTPLLSVNKFVRPGLRASV